MQFKVSQSLRNPNQTANIRRIGHPDELREQLFQEFVRCKKEKQVIRDRFLIDASLEIADRLQFHTFKASSRWLLTFKKRYGIVGRKITQVVSVKIPHEEADIDKLANEFLERVKLTIDAERMLKRRVPQNS